MRFSLRFIFGFSSAAALTLLPLSHAEGEAFAVSGAGCSLIRYDGRKWVKARKSEYPAIGTKFQGLPGSVGRIRFLRNKTYYELGEACVSREGVARTRAPQRGKATWNLQAGITSWQEEMSAIRATDANPTPILATTVVFSPGLSYISPISGPWELKATLSGLVGKSEGANSTSQSAAVVEADDTTLLGARLAPGIQWKLAEQGASIGASLLVVYRTMDFGDLPSDTQIDTGSPIFFGAQLETRLERSRFQFIPQMGFLGKLKYFSWSLEIGYAL
jgi:hypothetical protein